MYQLKDHSHFDMLVPFVAGRARAQDCQQRAQAFTAARDDVVAELVYEHHIGVKSGANELIDGARVIGDKRAQGFDIRSGFGVFQRISVGRPGRAGGSCQECP